MGQQRPTDFAGFVGMYMTAIGFGALALMFGAAGVTTGSFIAYGMVLPCLGVTMLAAYRAWNI